MAKLIILAQTSCGFAVPMVSSTLDPARIDEGPRAYLEDRRTLGHFAENTRGHFAENTREKDLMHEYRQKANLQSLNGCTGSKVARRQRGEWMLV